MSKVVITNLGATAIHTQTGQRGLPGASLIYSKVNANMNMPYDLPHVEAVEMVDRQIDPRQRFYRAEIKQAAQLLAEAWPITNPRGAGVAEWDRALTLYLGNRLVPVAACREGLLVNPITRQCTSAATERRPVIPDVPLPILPEPSVSLPPPPPEKAGALSPGLLIAAGIVALLVFR